VARSTSKGSGGGTSKIRFIMLDADLVDGDLSQITHAISSALGRLGNSGRLQSPTAVKQMEAGLAEQGEPEDEAESGAESPDADVRPSRPRRPRKILAPKVLNDIDWKSGEMSFQKLAEDAKPTSDLMKHLVVAYWFKLHRGLQSVTADHAYTCYKKMSWSADIADFIQPFRDLARRGDGEVKGGTFSINHIGEDKVEKAIATSA